MKKIIQALMIMSLCAPAAAQVSPDKTHIADAAVAQVQKAFRLNAVKAGQKQSTASNCKKDSTVSDNWDTLYNAWRHNNKALYAYDAQLKELSETDYDWNFSTSTWALSLKTTRSYDTQNNLAAVLLVYWNWTNSIWVNSLNYTYSYDAGNKLISETYQVWGSNAWTNSGKSVYTYNAANRVVSQLNSSWNTGSLSWNISNRISYTYDASNNITGMLYETWSVNTSSWVNDSKLTLTYSNNLQVGISQVFWNTQTNAWDNVFRITYTYAGSNVAMQVLEEWNSSTNAWENQSQELFGYDSYNNNTLRTGKAWNPNNNTYTPVGQQSSYFSCSTVDIKEAAGQGLALSLYPNPAQSELFIRSGVEFKSVSILDVTGQVVLSKEASGSVSVSQLQKGVYFIRLLDKDQNVLQTRKFVKE